MKQHSRHAPSSTNWCDIAVVGGGIAGQGIAWGLARAGLKVKVLDQSDHPPEHSTARSAALFSKGYAPNDVVSTLITASENFLTDPPPGFTDVELLHPRETIHIASSRNEEQLNQLHRDMRHFPAKTAMISKSEVLERVPILDPCYVATGIRELGSGDLDAMAIHAGFRNGFLCSGGEVVRGAELLHAARRERTWEIETSNGHLSADMIVNAAGAWGDIVAHRCGVRGMGLIPLARTAIVAHVEESAVASAEGIPFVFVPFDDLYFCCRPSGVIMSPADERPTVASDEQPEIEDIARTLDSFERVTILTPKAQKPRAWAGIRVFAKDRMPIVGFDPDVEGFFWLVGQGGFGIESSPALSALSAALILDQALPDCLRPYSFDSSIISPSRFR